MKGWTRTAFAILVSGCLSGVGLGQTVPPLRLQHVTGGLNLPVQMVPDPTDSSRLMVVEKEGRIRVVQNGVLLTTPFLNLVSQVNPMGEGGLLGMAFAPDYASSGVFYVYYQRRPRNGMTVERYRRAADSAVAADPLSAETVLFYPRNPGVHYGGWIGFSPLDRLLYIAVGDGAGNPQRLSEIGGKMLRIDVGSGTDDFPENPDKNYAVPATNPFRSMPGALPEVFLFGLRNPWRCSFDRATGDLYIGDVGTFTPGCVFVVPHAEVPEAVAPGLNFGYNCFDRGVPPTSPNTCSDNRPITTFAFAYPRDNGASLTGGFVYRGCAVPELRGRYLVMDYSSGACYSYPVSAGPVAELMPASPDVQRHTQLSIGGASSIGEDLYGELYVTNLNSGLLQKVVAVTPHFADVDGDGIPDGCELPVCGTADMGRAGGFAGGDGQLDNNDFIVFINAFFSGHPGADLGRAGGLTPGDGAFDNNDFIAFIGAFFDGCL